MKIPLLYLLLLSGASLYGTISDTYTQLQKTPRYRFMSPLEIAIDRGDFEAISYFEFRANLDELKKARVRLQNKVDNYYEIVKGHKDDFITGPEKVPSLLKVETSRRSKSEYESMYREFNRKIESMEKEEEIRQKAAEEAKKAAETPAIQAIEKKQEAVVAPIA